MDKKKLMALLVQYSRENQINSSASFGFKIHTGSDIDTTNFNMDVSISVKDSWNPISSKTIPIKKGDYWILENIDDLFPTEVGIDKVYFLPINSEASVNNSSLNDSNNSNYFNKSIEFPDGCCGEPVTWSLESFDYIVPEGKNLYITQYHNTTQNGGLFIGANQIVKGRSNYVFYTGVGFSPSNTTQMPIIVGEENTVSGDGSFNGFIIDAIVVPFTIDLYDTVLNTAENENIFILQFYGDDSAELLINDIPIFENYSNNIFYTGVGFTPAMTLSSPIMVGSNQLIEGVGTINGYITPLNYFSE